MQALLVTTMVNVTATRVATTAHALWNSTATIVRKVRTATNIDIGEKLKINPILITVTTTSYHNTLYGLQFNLTSVIFAKRDFFHHFKYSVRYLSI